MIIVVSCTCQLKVWSWIRFFLRWPECQIITWIFHAHHECTVGGVVLTPFSLRWAAAFLGDSVGCRHLAKWLRSKLLVNMGTHVNHSALVQVCKWTAAWIRWISGMARCPPRKGSQSQKVQALGDHCSFGKKESQRNLQLYPPSLLCRRLPLLHWPTSPARTQQQHLHLLGMRRNPRSNLQVTSWYKQYKEGLSRSEWDAFSLAEILDRSGSSEIKKITSELHKATAALGRATRQLQELQETKSQHRAKWLQHLTASLDARKKQIETYEQFNRS